MYTKEDWHQDKQTGYTIFCGKIQVATVAYAPFSREVKFANAQRIVDCVNGCRGINPEVVRDLYEACKAIWEAYGKSRLDYGAELLAEISKLDTLLAKAKEKK
ncbi:hypothetical protein LCGC14_0417160 [marine sediment metagenome]|uniref:Uncharacterized protein n=1 Tax=marine sediment metagenome TaxID=412755 RepID=A0A0F9TAA8_9ZZZZ